MVRDPVLATWLVARRQDIEEALEHRLGDSMPGPGAPEAEALRRFRTFAATSLRRGVLMAPSLDGIRVQEARLTRLLDAWAEAALQLAGERADVLREALEPLRSQFRSALRGTAPARRARGAPRATRRAVIAAIDRIADAFLAIDTDTGTIADANPAAGALLGRHRDALLGSDVRTFLPGDSQETWWTHLDAVSEGTESTLFRSALIDCRGDRIEVDARITRHASRKRTLALILARPLG